MVLRYFCLAVLSTLSFFAASAQTNDNAFKKEWLDIDTLIGRSDLARTALEKVKNIYTQAKQKQLPGEVVKSLIYRYTLEDRIIEDDPNRSVKSIRDEIAAATDETERAVLYAILAKQFRQYYMSRRVSFYSRKKTVDMVKEDIATWGSEDLSNAIATSYLLSLKNTAVLQRKNIDAYDAVIIKGNNRKLRPTLFDLLAHEALDYFKSGNSYNSIQVDPFVFNNDTALATANRFVRASFHTSDSSSNQWRALKLFQQLVSFHLDDKNKEALSDVDIERIEWSYSQLVSNNREPVYQATLQHVTEQYASMPASAYAWYLLARIETGKAQRYDPLRDTANRYAYVKAKHIVENALLLYKERNKGVDMMEDILTEINTKNIHTQTERVNVPGKPFRALASYRNTDTLFARVIQVDNNDSIRSVNRNRDYWKKLVGLAIYRSFIQVLPVNTDHRLHNAEIKIDALPVGEYALVSSSGKGFIDSVDKMSVQFFYVSNISYIKNKTDFFVLNRQDGSPMENVKVTIKNQDISESATTRKTDKNGYFRFEPKNERGYGNYTYSFTAQNDKLFFREGDYTYFDNEKKEESKAEDFEDDNLTVFYFTDRSIYRPGQTVYFKGIAVTKDFKTKLSKVYTSKDSGWVYLNDSKGKEIDSLRFKPNEYGSFTGKFLLPQNVLTGGFSIDAPAFGNGSADFSVEEYKRPKFNVVFQKPKGAYRLNDTIVVTGTAKAFAGNNIGGAKVSFSVNRNTRYQYSWRTNLPSPGRREISHGVITTDAEGKFTIKFKAQADDIADRSANPLFVFAVQADVTDINGETHIASTSVTTGYSSLILHITAPELAESDSLQHIGIVTTNFSDEKEPASVQVKIYALQSPGRPVRKRLWQRPDEFILSEKEFTRDFPTDEYANESDYREWKTGNIAVDGNVNTADTDIYIIPKGSLNAGYYKIEAVTKDKYGEEVKQFAYVRLFSRKSNQLPFPAYQFSAVVNNQAEPGETATILAGSSADNIFVISKTDHPKQKKSGYDFTFRKEGIHSIQYTPDEADRGGVSISEAYVFDNRVYTNQYNIFVPWNNKLLQVKYSSYRNMAEPGSAEKWVVSIQGNKGEKVAAELLTAMYDASLDEIKTHDWQMPYIWEGNNTRSYFEGGASFSINHGIENFLPNPVRPYIPFEYDHIANNAEELLHNNILRWIKEKDLPAGEIFKYATGSLDEVVVVGYGTQKNKALTGSVAFDAGMALQGTAAGVPISVRGIGPPGAAVSFYVVDGRVMKDMRDMSSLAPDAIESVKVLKGDEAMALYGSEAVNGAIIITTKNKQPVQVRKNFNETAFFFPQLYADTLGKYSFSFTMPEALTQWKWMSLAHTKDLSFGMNSTSIITQKKLMVQPNAPRFMREGDNMEFSSKIVNLTDKEITGQVTLELIDASTNTSVDGWFQNVFPSQYFTVAAGQSFAAKFPIQIPFSFNRPLTWRVVARSGEYSDGEENTLPVLTNRMLVTESLPLFLPNDTTKHFVFDKLLHNTSESLTQEALTVEYTSNPVWYAVQALPYLMEFPYECVEQTFNRFYANTLASYIVNKNPRIKQVFEQWKTDTSSLKSNLEKNEELKQVLMQETPWVLEAGTEAQKKKNLSLLFDLAKLSSQADALIEKLRQMQLPNGSFSWFKGGSEDRYMTNYILTGIGKLKRLGAISPETSASIRDMLVKALQFADSKTGEDYDWLVKNKVDLNLQQVTTTHIDYMYMRSFFRDIAQQSQTAYDYFFKQAKQFWIKQNSYYRAELGLICFRNNEETFAINTILPALSENAVIDPALGMYWKQAYTGSWYQSPIEHQSMMIAFMSEINKDRNDPSVTKNINAMKTWLLLNKQTNNWRTTVATADACYALLLNGSGWLNAEKKVTIQLGNYTVSSSNEKTEAGSGYFKKRIEGKQVVSEMGDITVTANSSDQNSKTNSSPSWGSVYWQYFEDLDKITPAVTPLSLNKKLFIERNTDKGKVLDPVKEGDELKPGDKIVVRITLKSDRDMDYLHLKDMRAASMEPMNVLSGYKWQDGLGYYESTKDASTNFFISHLSKGTYIFDYALFVTHTGVFSVGIATIQCMYAPEFTSHSEGIKIRVRSDATPNP